MKYPWKEILVAFVIGAIVGGFAVTRSFERPMPRKGGAHLVEKFSRELNLSSEQKEQVRRILKSKREQFRALRDQLKPRFDELRNSSRSEIEKILTPEQIPAFRQMEQRWKEKRTRQKEK